MIDFAVWEAKYALDGPMAICWFGAACSIAKNTKIGNIVLASQGEFYVQTDYDKLHDPDSKDLPYKISHISLPEMTLTNHMEQHLKESTEEGNFRSGLIGTTDSFYNSQCWFDPKFADRNEKLYE